MNPAPLVAQALQAFRMLRILRTVRIFRAYKNFRRLMDSIVHGLISLREFLLLLGICIFIFAVLGMQVSARAGGKTQYFFDEACSEVTVNRVRGRKEA